MKNPFREYRKMKNIIEYYESHMRLMMRCRKFAALGLLLLSNVKKGDIVYVIGNQLRIFNRVHTCKVQSIEFIGHNDSLIICCDITDSSLAGNKYAVRNNQFGRYFFCEYRAAKEELDKLLS